MFRPNGATRRPWPKYFWPAVLLTVTAMLLLMPKGPTTSTSSKTGAPITGAAAKSAAAPTGQVPVTLFVMSLCPDARFCLQALKPVIETLPSVVTLRTEYIAGLNKEEDKVQCMHGQSECDGNKQQLCLQQHLPASEKRKYLQMLLCHGEGGLTDIKQLTKCMTEGGLDAGVQADVLKCVEGEMGTKLQVASSKQVTGNAVKKSCTVFVDGKKRCIRDGGRWYDCEGGSETQDFVKSICDAHKAKAGKEVSSECKAALGKPATDA